MFVGIGEKTVVSFVAHLSCLAFDKGLLEKWSQQEELQNIAASIVSSASTRTGDPQEAAFELVRNAFVCGSEDNISALVIPLNH